MQEFTLFSRKIYTVGKNFTHMPVVTVATNLNSTLSFDSDNESYLSYFFIAIIATNQIFKHHNYHTHRHRHEQDHQHDVDHHVRSWVLLQVCQVSDPSLLSRCSCQLPTLPPPPLLEVVVVQLHCPATTSRST